MAVINLYNIDSRYQEVLSTGATHYTVSENTSAVINLYDYFGKDDVAPIQQLERAVLIKCIDYHLGSDQSWAMVKIVDESLSQHDLYNQIIYMKIYDLMVVKDPATAEPIFSLGDITSLIPEINPNYNLGKWYKKRESEAFYNEKSQQYMVSVSTDFTDIPKNESDLYDIKQKGLIALCEFYAKEYDLTSSIPSMLSYHNFVTIEKTHVPPRPNQNTKCLVAVHARYFNAIPQKQQDTNMLLSALSGFDGGNQTGFRTVIFDTSKLSKQVKFITRKFESYQQKVASFSGNVKNVDFKKEKKHFNNFFLGLKKLLTQNGFKYDSRREDSIEIGIANEDEDNLESCVEIKYVLFSQPYSYQMMSGFNSFATSESASRQNTINLFVSIYDVIRDMKANMDWINFSSKYFMNPPIISPTKKISTASKSSEMRRNPFEVFFQKSRFFNATPYFNADTLKEIDNFIRDPNVTKGLLRENKRSFEYVGDPLYNDLPNIIADIGDLDDIFSEILFKIGLKDIVGKIIACLTKDLKISDSREVLIRGFLQSASLKKLYGILFHPCVPEAIKMNAFISLFSNLRLGSEQLIKLFDLLDISPKHILYYKHPSPDDLSQSDYETYANNPYELGGILTSVINDAANNEAYVRTMNRYSNRFEDPTESSFLKCKVKASDFLTSDSIILVLSHMVAFGVSDIEDIHDFDSEYTPTMNEYGDIEIGMEVEELRGKILEYLPEVITKSEITNVLNNVITEIISIPMGEVITSGPSVDMFNFVANKLGVSYSANLSSSMPANLSSGTFLNLVLECMGLEDEVSAFYGFVKNIQDKYSNILGNFEIPDIVLGKAKFDFSFNNVFLNPKFDLTAWNIKFNDDLMGDIIATVLAAIKDAIKHAILAIIESMISALDDCISGGDESINDALYGQECIKELYEASSGTTTWETFLDNLFEEALQKINSGECKECSPVPLEEQADFIDIVCETLTPQELLSLMRASERNGISAETLSILSDLADPIQFPNINCILSGDILVEMFGDIGSQIDDDLLDAVENLYELTQGVPLSACLNGSYGEETYQNPEAALEPDCNDVSNNCIQIPKRFRSVREMLQCRGLSEDEINQQISDSVNDKKEELVNMIVAANKRPEDMLNIDNMCQFLPKPSQIPAMKFASDVFFEAITDNIKASYTNDCLTYPDIMMHPDPTNSADKTTTYIALKIPGGSVYGYTVIEDANTGVQKLAEVLAEDENGNPVDLVNPQFRAEYTLGEKIYNRTVDFYGVETITEINEITWDDTNDQESVTECVNNTLSEDKIWDTDADGNIAPGDQQNLVLSGYDLLIKRQSQKKRVAPLLENALEDIYTTISAMWQYDPERPLIQEDNETYTIRIGAGEGEGDLVRGALGQENSLILPADLTSQNPNCEEFKKLELPAVCSIEDQPVIASVTGRYDRNTAEYFNIMMDKDNVLTSKINDTYPDTNSLSDFLADFTFSDSNSWQNVSESLLNSGDIVGEGGRDLVYFHNMVRSFVNFFATSIQSSDLFDPKKMQTFRIEPRAANVNSTSVSKKVKSLLDFEDALKRAQEFFEENCSFGDIGPEDITTLQQAGIYAIIILTIRIYIVDILMRGVFLLTTVLKEEIGDAFFAILFDNFRQDLQEFSPEYYVDFMDTIEKIYNAERANNIELPEIAQQEQILKYYMKKELTLMNITLQEIFRKAYKSVKSAFVSRLDTFEIQRITDVIYWYNRELELGDISSAGAVQTTEEGIEELQSFLDGVDIDKLQNIESSFFLKRYLIDNSNPTVRLDWSEQNYENYKANASLGLELCYFDLDKGDIAHKAIVDNAGLSDYRYQVVYGGIGTKVVKMVDNKNKNNYFFSVYKTNQKFKQIPSKEEMVKALFGDDFGDLGNEDGSIVGNTTVSFTNELVNIDPTIPYIASLDELFGINNMIITFGNVEGDGDLENTIDIDIIDVFGTNDYDGFFDLLADPATGIPWFAREKDRMIDEAIQENYQNIGSPQYYDETTGQLEDFIIGPMATNEHIGSFVVMPIAKCETSWDFANTSYARFESDYWPTILAVLKQGIFNDSTLSNSDADLGLGFNSFFTDCIPAEVLYDLLFSYVVAMTSRYVPNIEGTFQTTKEKLKSAFNSLNVPFGDFEYSDGDIKEKGGATGMYQSEYTNSSTTPNVSAMAAKMAAMTPFLIIKGLAEQFDPNIKIAKFIRTGALAAGVDLPIQLASLVVSVPPVIGPGLIPGPLGLIYLATEFLEPKERERLAEIEDGVNSTAPGEEGYEIVEPPPPEPEPEPVVTDADILTNFTEIMQEVWETIYDLYAPYINVAVSDTMQGTPAGFFRRDGSGPYAFMDPNISQDTSALYWMEKMVTKWDNDTQTNRTNYVLTESGADRNKFMAIAMAWLTMHGAWNFFWRWAYLYPTGIIDEPWDEDAQDYTFSNHSPESPHYCFVYEWEPNNVEILTSAFEAGRNQSAVFASDRTKTDLFIQYIIAKVLDSFPNELHEQQTGIAQSPFNWMLDFGNMLDANALEASIMGSWGWYYHDSITKIKHLIQTRKPRIEEMNELYDEASPQTQLPPPDFGYVYPIPTTYAATDIQIIDPTLEPMTEYVNPNNTNPNSNSN